MAILRRRKAEDPKVTWLREARFLSGLSDTELEEVAANCDRASRPAGTHLADEGHLGVEAFLITAGRVEVRHGDEVVAELGPGDVVGEGAVAGTNVRNASVVVVEDVELAVFDAGHFRGLTARIPAFAAAVETVMRDRGESG